MIITTEKEWLAINFYCNKKFRKAFVLENKKLLREGLSTTIKGWWDKAKEKAKGFLDSIKNIAGNLVPTSFLVGLSKLGDAGKKIWEFVSTLAGNAYKYLTEAIDKAKAFIEKQKEQLVANVINLILKVVYKSNVNLYNQIVIACEQARINTGLKVDQRAQPQQQQQQQVKEGIVGAAIHAANYAAGGQQQQPSANPREQVANLLEQAFKVISTALTPQLKQQIIETVFPFDAASPEAIGITLMVPLAQASGSLNFDTLVAFVTQVVNAAKHIAAKAAGKISLFREHKLFLFEIRNSFTALLVNNFDSVTGAIVGLVKGSNIENIIRAVGGDAGAAKNVVSQLLKLLVDAVKKQTKDETEAEPSDEVLEKASEFLMGESKVKLAKILFER